MTELNYSDISLKPRKCIVDSREKCITKTTLGKIEFEMPIYPANMKSVVDRDTCMFFAKNNWFYTMHRFDIDVMDFIYAMNTEGLFTSISVGVNQDSYDELDKIHQEPLTVDYITIDVANAWSDKTKNMARYIKEKFPETFLIIGNVATSEAIDDLEEWGADAIKVGIAGGCFIAGTKINTLCGEKNIEDIRVDDEVLTHKGNYKKVEVTTNRLEEELLISINDNIVCTPNHEIYVLKKIYEKEVIDSNIHQYAEWIKAEELNKDYYLLKIKEG